jgi:hypothetical protein
MDVVETSPGTDAPTEAFRRAGLFFGAALLGLVSGRWLAYAIDRSGTVFPVFPVAQEPLVDLVFFVVGVLLAYRLKSVLLRSAWIVFAAAHLLLSIRQFGESAVAPWVATSASALFALIVVAAGARRRTSRELALAVAIFIAATGFQMGLTEWSKRLRGVHSVVSLQVWRT